MIEGKEWILSGILRGRRETPRLADDPMVEAAKDDSRG